MARRLRASERNYRSQQRIAEATVRAGRRAWGRVDIADLNGSWSDFGRDFLPVFAAGQSAAAQIGADYIAEAAAENGLGYDPVGSVSARNFAGIASDGRPLGTLAYSPFAQTKGAIGRGLSEQAAMQVGQSAIDRIVSTQVADANRGGQVVAMAASPTITGYTRMLNPPSCSRCAILAGKWFRKNTGFQRHPACDCIHVPADQADVDLTTDPNAYFNSLTPEQQDAIFGKAGADAIRRGADMGRVVNAERGMVRPGSLTTTELKRYAMRPGGRLSPDGILKVARSDDEIVALLKANGYISSRRPIASRPSAYLGQSPKQMGNTLSQRAAKRGRKLEVSIPDDLDAGRVREAVETIDRLLDDFPEVNLTKVAIGDTGRVGRAYGVTKGYGAKGGGAVASSEITLTPGLFRTTSPMYETMQRESAGGWSTFSDVRGIAAHEFGHALDKTYGGSALNRRVFYGDGPPVDYGVDVGQQLRDMHAASGGTTRYAEWMKSQISEYAGTNTDELIAEAFSQVWSGRETPASRLIYDSLIARGRTRLGVAQ